MTEKVCNKKVSIVIPVYNAQEFLIACLSSLVDQSFDKDKMEVLTVVDGSTDGSLEICKEFAEKYNFFTVIEQENSGVSAARNNGIRSAHGKYIMFLDSDDTLTPETVKNVISFFEKHDDEIDAVTYPIQYITGKGTSSHWRYEKCLTETAVYDLAENPYICQSTMNICVRNRFENNIYFNTKLKMAEDQLFVTENLLRKAKIGFVKEACYKYLKHGDNQSNKGNHPYYALEQMFLLFEALLGYKSDYPKMSEYLQAMTLYNINWRMNQNLFYTHHLVGDEQKRAEMRYINVFNGLSNKTVLGFPVMSDAYKNYIIMKKTKDKPTAQSIDDKLLLIDTDGSILSESSSVDIGITRCQFEHNSDVFYMQGYIQSYAIDISGEIPELYINQDGINQKLPLYPSGRRCYKTDEITNNFWAFHYKVNITQNIKNIKIYVKFKEHMYPVKIDFQDTQPMQPKLKRNAVKGKKYAVKFINDSFEVCRRKSLGISKIMLSHLIYLLKNDRAALFKRLFCMVNRIGIFNKIWLYNDSYSTASDNGYVQFVHDFAKKDGIKRYYVYEREELIKGKFTPEQQKYLVKFRSGKHKRLYMRADKILTSFLNFNSYIPFTSRKSMTNFLDLVLPEIIYLQHGVMHAKVPNLYHKENSYLGDKIVASTVFEYENFTTRLGYRKEDVLTCGMPRLDLLKADPTKLKNKILFAPSWRAYLIGPLIDSSRITYAEFDSSEYFLKFNEFLNSSQLYEILEKYDLTVDVKLHPIFSCYRDKFKFTGNRVRLVDNAELDEYKLCITDFSSYIFDLLYLKKPIIMFMPDKEKFSAGLHSYREFYLPLNDGFGDYVESAEDCISAIKKLAENDFKTDKRYEEKVEQLFFTREPIHRDALYDAVYQKD